MKCADTGFVTLPLLEFFKQIPDYRCGRKKKHDLAEMLTCITIGYVCGRTTIRRSLKWCEHHLEWLRKFMPLKNGIASGSTVSRMFSGIDEELFQYTFMEWIGEIVDSKGTHLAIDGKALRAATEKVKTFQSPMVINVVEVVTGLVLAQIPVDCKENEITVIPKVLELLDIRDSTITVDAIGTQGAIMDQIVNQGGHFVLSVKKNQPEACAEIHEFMDRLETEGKKEERGEKQDSVMKEFLEKYDVFTQTEKNRDRYEYRTYRVCNDASELTKSQKEWPFVRSIGRVEQVRVPIEKDRSGNDITPTKEEFLKHGSRRCPIPSTSEGAGKDIQSVAMISDRILTAEELGTIKRKHWTVENRLHHILDDSFREDRSPARKSRNNLALIRKYAYNLLRLAMIGAKNPPIMTEMMDRFCDEQELREQYIFHGIASLY